MSNATPMLTQFNAGELSPLMAGRVDTDYYAKGCRTLRNFLPMPQGAAKRRGGTRFLGNGGTVVLSAGQPVLMIPFVRSQTESYVVEINGAHIRFWYNGAVVQNGGFPVIVVTPYDYNDLFNADGTPAINFVQSADVMYLMHPDFPTQKLSHFSATNWTLTVPNFLDGPWLAENDDDNNTMTVSAINGTITISAALGGTFDQQCVGQKIRIFQNDLSLLKAWYPGQRTTNNNLKIGDLRRSGPNTYKLKSAAPGSSSGPIDWVETGSDTLVATKGDQWDGPQDVVPNPATAGHYYGRGIQWTYQDSGYGVATITQRIDSQHVIATVTRQFPASLTGALPSSRWQLGAWAPYLGYPSIGCFFRERLTFGNGIYVWMSVAGDFENFADQSFGVIANDNAITIQVLSDSVNAVTWFAPSNELMVGTEGNEFIITQNTLNEPFGPLNYAMKKQSSYGGRHVPAIILGGSTFFVTRTGRFVREFQYSIETDSFQSKDVSLPSEHITKGGVCAMQYSQNPDTVIWMVLNQPNDAGATLISYTVNIEQQVRGWVSHPIGGGGIVKSIAVVPSIAGDYDELYLCVLRTVNSVQTCCIERLEQSWRPGDAQSSAFYVDAGGTYNGSPTTTISGLSYINGYTVSVFADGQPQADKVVTSGTITLDQPASIVQVGLPYDAILQPMRIEAGGMDGPSQGRIKRINKVIFRFLNSLGGLYGRDVFDGSPLDQLSYSDAPNPVSAGTTFYTGDTPLLDFQGEYDQEGYIGYINSQPLPVTICAIMPAEVTYGPW